MEGLQTKHVSQFYPCSKVTLGSELLYLCELGKYLGSYGFCLSLDGVILDNILKKSRFWDYMRVAVKSGWLVDVNVDKFELDITIQNPINLSRVRNIFVTTEKVTFDYQDNSRRNDDVMYDWMTPKRIQISFTAQNDNCWFWSINGADTEGFSANQNNVNNTYSSQIFTSILAYVAVNRLINGVPQMFAMEFDDSILNNKQIPIADIELLHYETDATNGWFAYDIGESEAVQNKCGYVAWWYKGLEQGYCHREFSGDEKRKYFADLGMKLNDVVLLYERKSCQSANYIKEVSSMHIAIVRGINKTGLTLEIVNNKKTRHGYELWFSSLPEAVQKMYLDGTSYKEYRGTVKKYDWIDVGVNYMLRSELNFITPLQLEDSVPVGITNGIDSEHIWLREDDAIYWILKDYDVSFNEEHFLKLYFEGRTPAYTRYQNGDPLSEFERYTPPRIEEIIPRSEMSDDPYMVDEDDFYDNYDNEDSYYE